MPPLEPSLETLVRQLARKAPPLRLAARDLQDKWGFGDGDMLTGWLEEHVLAHPDIARRLGVREFTDEVYNQLDLSPRDAMALLVLGFLVPRIEQELEVEIVPTLHNPVLTKSVEGRPIECRNRKHAHPARPAAVVVDGEMVWEVVLLTRSPGFVRAQKEAKDWEDIHSGLERLVPEVLELGVQQGALGKAEIIRALRSSGKLMHGAAQRLLARLRFPEGEGVRVSEPRSASSPA